MANAVGLSRPALLYRVGASRAHRGRLTLEVSSRARALHPAKPSCSRSRRRDPLLRLEGAAIRSPGEVWQDSASRWYALAGIPLETTPGAATITLRATSVDGETTTSAVTARDCDCSLRHPSLESRRAVRQPTEVNDARGSRRNPRRWPPSSPAHRLSASGADPSDDRYRGSPPAASDG